MAGDWLCCVPPGTLAASRTIGEWLGCGWKPGPRSECAGPKSVITFTPLRIWLWIDKSKSLNFCLSFRYLCARQKLWRKKFNVNNFPRLWAFDVCTIMISSIKWNGCMITCFSLTLRPGMRFKLKKTNLFSLSSEYFLRYFSDAWKPWRMAGSFGKLVHLE